MNSNRKKGLKHRYTEVLFIIILLVVSFVFLILFLVRSGFDDDPERISIDELRIEIERLDELNEHPNNMNIDPSDYPKDIGIFSENGLKLIEEYHCSDVCPDYGGVLLIYKDIETKEDCDLIGGRAEIDLAWGPSYIGCSPKLD